MKFMVIVKATPESEAEEMPGPEIFEAMGRFNEEMIEAGVMIAGEGLMSSRRGARLRFTKGKHVVIDGPFAETKELVAGFWIIDVRDRDEAIAWMKKYPFAEGEEIEIRKVWEPTDWEEAGAPDVVLEQYADIEAKESGGKGK